MEKYTNTYLKYFGYQIIEDTKCECCWYYADDKSDVPFCTEIHHIYGRVGTNANAIENLVGICRRHHNDAHNEIIKEDEMQMIHNRFMESNF